MEEVASWSCRCCTCCFGGRLRWRRCVCARASSRNSRSWCSATSWLCFVARSPVRSSTRATASSLLRPAGCSTERADRSSSVQTRCWVGIGSLCGGGGPTPVGGRVDPRYRRRFVSSCCGSRVRIRAGATSGSSVNSPVSECACRQLRSPRSCGKPACRLPVLAPSSAGATSCVLTPTRSSPATSSLSKRSGSDASMCSSSSSSIAGASTSQAAPPLPRDAGQPSTPGSLPGHCPSGRPRPGS